jgi:hypothetical protein
LAPAKKDLLGLLKLRCASIEQYYDGRLIGRDCARISFGAGACAACLGTISLYRLFVQEIIAGVWVSSYWNFTGDLGS